MIFSTQSVQDVTIQATLFAASGSALAAYHATDLTSINSITFSLINCVCAQLLQSVITINETVAARLFLALGSIVMSTTLMGRIGYFSINTGVVLALANGAAEFARIVISPYIKQFLNPSRATANKEETVHDHQHAKISAQQSAAEGTVAKEIDAYLHEEYCPHTLDEENGNVRAIKDILRINRHKHAESHLTVKQHTVLPGLHRSDDYEIETKVSLEEAMLKQCFVSVLGAVRHHFNIPKEENLNMSDPKVLAECLVQAKLQDLKDMGNYMPQLFVNYILMASQGNYSIRDVRGAGDCGLLALAVTLLSKAKKQGSQVLRGNFWTWVQSEYDEQHFEMNKLREVFKGQVGSKTDQLLDDLTFIRWFKAALRRFGHYEQERLLENNQKHESVESLSGTEKLIYWLRFGASTDKEKPIPEEEGGYVDIGALRLISEKGFDDGGIQVLNFNTGLVHERLSDNFIFLTAMHFKCALR